MGRARWCRRGRCGWRGHGRLGTFGGRGSRARAAAGDLAIDLGEDLRDAVLGVVSRRHEADGTRASRHRRDGPVRSLCHMSPFWIWTQVLIVLFVVAGIVIAVTKIV